MQLKGNLDIGETTNDFLELANRSIVIKSLSVKVKS